MKETIIVQDEDGAILDVLKLALELEGFIVIPMVHCDENFIETIKKHRPHVVLLDIRLEQKACIDICHRIKEQFPHLPVIALSCNINIKDQYAKEGFDNYISKPFDLNLLYKIIRMHIPGSSESLEQTPSGSFGFIQ